MLFTILLLVHLTQGSILYTEQLHDGVLIESPRPIKLQKAEWTLLITIGPPHLLNLSPYLSLINDMVYSLEQDDAGTVYRTLRHRLKYLRAANQQLTAALTIPARTRRGLLNIGGKILHHLFGVATDEDLRKYRSTVRRAIAGQVKITHDYQAMATVINHIQDTVIENQHTLHDWYQNVTAYMDNLTVAVSNRLYAAKRHVLINDLLDLTDSYYLRNAESIELYLQQRADLELGMLTEHVMPQYKLQSFLSKIQPKHFNHLETLPIPWYYENLHIQPVWQEDNILVFIAKIPFVAPQDYLLFHINTYPVGHNKTTVKLTPETIIASDPQSNGLFIPEHCRGMHPLVCSTSLIGYSPMYDCERGLLLHQVSAIETCPVTIQTDVLAPKSYPVKSHEGQFVLYLDTTEDVTLHCPGSPVESHSVSPGTYRVTVPDHCALSSSLWILTTWIHGSSTMNATSELLPIPVLSLKNLSTEVHLPKIEQLHVPMPPTLSELKKMTLPNTSDIIDYNNPFTIMNEHSNKFLITLYLIIIVIIVLIIIYCCKLKHILCFKSSQVKPVQLNESSSTLQLTPSCPSMYPSLTSLTTSNLNLPTNTITTTTTTLTNHAPMVTVITTQPTNPMVKYCANSSGLPLSNCHVTHPI